MERDYALVANLEQQLQQALPTPAISDNGSVLPFFEAVAEPEAPSLLKRATLHLSTNESDMALDLFKMDLPEPYAANNLGQFQRRALTAAVSCILTTELEDGPIDAPITTLPFNDCELLRVALLTDQVYAHVCSRCAVWCLTWHY